MKAVKLQYLGKTEVLKITQPHLSRPYTFDKKTGSEAVVLYEDAKIMLAEGPKAFKVVSGIIEAGPDDFKSFGQPSVPPPPPPPIEPVNPVEPEPAPQDAATDETPVEPVLTGDGVEGTGDMPPIEEGRDPNEPTPPPIPPAKQEKKTGKK